MPSPKPVTLTSITAANYKGDGDPQPLVVVGPGAVSRQAAIANQAAPAATLADLAAARTELAAHATKINAILAALRSAGIINT